MNVAKISSDEITRLLDRIGTYNENEHYSRGQFEKHLFEDPEMFGLYDNGKCVALAFTRLNDPKNGFSYLSQLSSFIKGKNYGMKLLESLVESGNCPNLWLMSNPEAGESVAKIYRKTELFEEFTISKSIYSGKEIHFFMHISGSNKENKTNWLKDYLTGVFAE